MPSSWWHVIPIVCEELDKRRPKRVLDIGVGYGKYGFLAREYGKAEQVDGVEGEPRYLTQVHSAIYNQLYTMDIRNGLSRLPRDWYDLVIMADVIEHLAKDDGHKVLRHFHAPILITTPEIDYPQHDPEFPLEDHISHWEEKDFAAYHYERLPDPEKKALIVIVNGVKDGY